MDSIEDSLQLHPVCLVLFDVGFTNTSSQNSGRMLYPSRFLFAMLIYTLITVFLPTNFSEEPNLIDG